MKCVKCEGTLERVEVGGVTLDQCSECAGIWFDGGELERVLGMKRLDGLKRPTKKNATHDQMRGKCPRCGGAGPLVRVASTTSDIHIDTCAVCGGRWLDGGEIGILRDEGGIRRALALLRKIASV